MNIILSIVCCSVLIVGAGLAISIMAIADDKAQGRP